ncbi:hypothetical protein HYH03_002383 [Edaphochlamys debaryana]|uniref:Transaldolase n=1 Tax=Edaphochlamys debaryana TaxID=47281 RepID=A0A836C3T3_9CHLO|nr:hypothetical protein HYH03_002383 [Edaphochlamys debaryana]|eukprot:KAG2499436.1 hypothetical protein HYH03_002383 [Edaphochlamys debaryana]
MPRARVTRRSVAVRASAAPVTPSSATSANELQSLGRLSTIVPDTFAMETLTPGAKLAAATVSAATLRYCLMGGSTGLKPYENAINAALAAGKGGSSPLAAASDPLDRAMVNVGAMLCDAVWGRVETVVDPRICNDTGAIVSKVRSLAALYGSLRVPRERLVFALPATWAATQAAKPLEAEGIATNVNMVFSMAQGVAAMQAGASVIRVNVGRIREWYDKNPGAIKNPRGPREDAGLSTSYDPGLELVRSLYTYKQRYHPRTAIMAMGLRTRQDALDLAGVDYLILSSRVIEQLSAIETDQGYNDGLSAVGGSGGVDAALYPGMPVPADFQQWPALTEAEWREGLGLCASELLKTQLARRVADVEELVALMGSRITASF